MTYYAIKNPNGCVLRFVKSYNETDGSTRKSMMLEWFENQSPSLASDKFLKIYSDYDALFNFDIELIDKLFIDLGWLTHIVKPLLNEKFHNLMQNGLLKNEFGKIELTRLGEYLLDRNEYEPYVKSMSFKANFWKRNNVKITDNKEIGSGSFISENTILTCKHVIDELDLQKIIIEDESKNRYSIKNVIRHPNDNVDMVKIVTNEKFDFFPYVIDENVRLLESVIIFGYPPIPLTSEAFLIANLGEVSAEVDNYIDKTDCIILSSITRPGNSGGPVINKNGKLIGIMIQNRQHKVPINWDGIGDIDFNKGLGYATALKSKYVNQF